ncbi:hypothetical protein MOQ72_11880 [Saccharopolyspora sp. K220]|uniref:hypothetical protein n=1 Tax=Saccharopolyspora soli TaxID=2926618 RepID=UPI001F57D0D7|nr:hypothetical protein [Saccharopolyspora soli]MCI2418127.1 hypothetical protein [Saccharopolyspora soli]
MGTTVARRSGSRALVLWPVLVCAAFLLLGCADSARRDATKVYCLSTAQQGSLVDAAVALGLAERTADATSLVVTGTTRPLKVEDWSKQRPSDFDRACKALSAPALAANPSGAQALWNVLLPVVAGAVLTLLTTTWRDETSRGRLLADDLRTAATAFTSAAKEYLGGWTEPGAPRPAEQDVRDRRAELAARLRTVRVLHSRWRAPREAQQQLTGNRLGDEIVQGWTTIRDDERTQRAATLHDELSQLDTTINQIAHALERPWRPHRRMRRAEPRKTDR